MQKQLVLHSDSSGELLTRGHSPYLLDSSRKTRFNSMFLAQYDSHFNSIQHIYTQTTLFKLLQSTMPDAVTTKSRADEKSLQFDAYKFYADLSAGLGDLTLGSAEPVSTNVKTVIKLLYQFRYRNSKKLSKHLHVFMDQKYTGSGFLKSGRYGYNLRRNVRYGAFVRVGFWAFYSGASLAYQLGSKNPGRVYRRFTAVNLQNRPSAFFRKQFKNILFSHNGSRQLLLIVMLSAVTALRTVWFSTARYLHTGRFVRSSAGVKDVENFKHHEIFRFGLRAFKWFRTAPAVGVIRSTTDLHLTQPITYKKWRLRHHNRRIAFTWYEKKMWGYRKNHRYWRYMKWVAHFYFRGIAHHRLFSMRLDVFLVQHLRIRNIRYARLVIKGGHAFIGDTVCYHANQPVNPMTVVSISELIRGWLFFYNNRAFRMTSSRKRSKSIVQFARLFGNGYIYGPHNTFAIPYGDPLDILWARNVTKADKSYYGLSYYQGQKMVSSAWW